ncbi:MAG: hypothetical protein CVV27_10005 [Candidatus Melainabacteria bacterium HGW-Melainabacteria-1]|nr:MAG: hypothetical protein CVV27_10005 [Candidatus Melainabacteria bacterium HGW-Melainabacteria-1]
MKKPSSWVPAQLTQQVGLNWGEAGKAWLKALPTVISQLETELGLKELMPCENMRLHWIGHALRGDSEVTLKLSIPDVEFETELRALVRMQVLPHMVRLRESSAEGGWMMLERIRPGSPLSALEDDLAALEIWLTHIEFLPANALDYQRFPDLARWCRALWLEDMPNWLAPAVLQARELYQTLASDEQATLLLHGDLHHENMLSDGPTGWKMIDPKGVIAGPEFELGAMLRNPYPDWNASAQLESSLRNRLERIAADPRFRFERVMNWAYVQSVLAACWSRNDQQVGELWLQVAFALDRLGR